ncbi:MAG: cytidine deaminase [Candidatus Aureabacteria bacterium]|nr:cytidine deaminase [Candidatus Auribacterota bacterium]
MENTEYIKEAKKISRSAYAPYSGVKVGAILISEDGKAFEGCNIENASFGLTVCAERVALFKAVSEGKRKFSKIIIASEGQDVSPCGACRQVLSEFSPEMTVVWQKNGKTVSRTLRELLPERFDFKK